MIYVVGVDNDTQISTAPSPNHNVPTPPSPIKISAKARGKIKAVEQNEVPYLALGINAEEEELGPICIA